MRPRLLFLVKYLLFWLLYFVVGKLVFLIWFWRQTTALPLTTTLRIIAHGLRMDAAATAYVAGIPFLLVTLSSLVPWRYLRPVIFWFTVAALVWGNRHSVRTFLGLEFKRLAVECRADGVFPILDLDALGCQERGMQTPIIAFLVRALGEVESCRKLAGIIKAEAHGESITGNAETLTVIVAT